MKEFFKYQQEIANLQYTINLLQWELKISAPKDSKENLVELISYHQTKLFELQTSEYYGKLLNFAIASEEFKQLSETEKRYINILKRHYDNYKNI